jgi:hypothetical protein
LPKTQFKNLPPQLQKHILQRVDERAIRLTDLLRLQEWVASEPASPDGPWYKDFGSFKLCGTAEFPTTVLTKRMKSFGEEMD